MNKPDFNIMEEFSRLLRSSPEKTPEGGWRAVYRLEPDFIGFQGHFPDYPLMPALMQVLMSAHMLGLALQREVQITALPLAKFTGQARPGDELVCLALPLPPKNGQEFWDVQVDLAGDEAKSVSSFKLACGA